MGGAIQDRGKSVSGVVGDQADNSLCKAREGPDQTGARANPNPFNFEDKVFNCS